MIANEIDHDEMVLISQFYPSAINQLSPPALISAEEGCGGGGGGEGKTRRRRKKNKSGENNMSGFRKRKLNQEQVNMLEQSFGEEHKLESERKDKLAAELGLDPRQVAVWFQNRRARWKSKKLEEEYVKLKTEHDSTVLQKCCLESEVLKLQEKLSAVEREMQKMLENSNNSPSSSLSMEAMEMQQPPYLGEFGIEGLENVFYIPESNYVIPGLDWSNLYI